MPVHAYAVQHGDKYTINIGDGTEIHKIPFAGTWDEARAEAAELDAFLSIESATPKRNLDSHPVL